MAVQSTSTQQVIPLRLSYQKAKRLLDIVFTLLILLPLCIVIGMLAVCIRLDSPGPIFFRQRRVGANGVEFAMLKLRSMYVNSDDARHREAIQRYMNGGTLQEGVQSSLRYKLGDDPRITRVGKFIRKLSLDELPQFFNVLRGEMSLVGPRPPLPYEVEMYSAKDYLRLSGRPGLTGTWQVYGRSRVAFAEMIDMDIAYLQQQSILEDLKLILLTVPVMLLGRGGA